MKLSWITQILLTQVKSVCNYLWCFLHAIPKWYSTRQILLIKDSFRNITLTLRNKKYGAFQGNWWWKHFYNLHFGPSHRCIQEIFLIEGEQSQAFSVGWFWVGIETLGELLPGQIGTSIKSRWWKPGPGQPWPRVIAICWLLVSIQIFGLASTLKKIYTHISIKIINQPPQHLCQGQNEWAVLNAWSIHASRWPLQ